MKLSKFWALIVCALFTFGTSFTVLSCADGSSPSENQDNPPPVAGDLPTTSIAMAKAMKVG